MPPQKRLRLFKSPIDGLPALLRSAENDKTQLFAARKKSRDQLFGQIIKNLCEREIQYRTSDKIFASKWLDNDTILLGSKDNSFFELRLSSRSLRVIDRPAAPPRQFTTDISQDIIGWGNCGIHCIDVNPCGDLIATGGDNPADLAIMRTADHDYKPVHTLIGHRDWVFGAAWVTDRHVVTGSRDQSVSLWQVDPDDVALGDAPTVLNHDYYSKSMKRKFEGKVREVKYDSSRGYVAALSTSCAVQLMDPGRDLRTLRSLNIPRAMGRDLVAMAYRHDMIAVGSLNHVLIIDPRKRDPGAHVSTLTSPDREQGVRSICFQDNILSYGTGRGKIAFFDIRAEKYLYMNGTLDSEVTGPGPGPGNSNGTLPTQFNGRLHELGAHMTEHVPAPTYGQYIELGKGWLLEDFRFWAHFANGSPVKNACYTHAWDQTGTRLFAAGGPLAYGLYGGYIGVWE